MGRLLSTSFLVTQRAYVQNCSQFWRHLRSDVFLYEGNMDCVFACAVLNGGVFVVVWCTLTFVPLILCHWPKPPDALILFSLICHLETRRWGRQNCELLLNNCRQLYTKSALKPEINDTYIHNLGFSASCLLTPWHCSFCILSIRFFWMHTNRSNTAYRCYLWECICLSKWWQKRDVVPLLGPTEDSDKFLLNSFWQWFLSIYWSRHPKLWNNLVHSVSMCQGLAAVLIQFSCLAASSSCDFYLLLNVFLVLVSHRCGIYLFILATLFYIHNTLISNT